MKLFIYDKIFISVCYKNTRQLLLLTTLTFSIHPSAILQHTKLLYYFYKDYYGIQL